MTDRVSREAPHSSSVSQMPTLRRSRELHLAELTESGFAALPSQVTLCTGRVMIGNKRTLSYMEPLGHGKVARLDKMNPQGSSTGLCKARGLPPYSTEDPLNYNGAYFAYYLKGQDGSDVPLRWSPPGPYLHDRRNAVVHPLTSERPLPPGLMYRPEKELGQAFAPEKTSPLPLGDKWGDFVDRQSKVSHGPGLHAPVAVRKMALGGTAGNAPPEHSVGSLAIPKPLYKTRMCCADAECKTRGCVPLEPEAERIQGRSYEGDWRGGSALCYGALPALDKRTSLLEADSLQLEPSGAARRQSKELSHPGYVPAGHLGAVSAFPEPGYNAVSFNGPPHALPVSSHKGCVNVSQPSDVYHHDAPAGLLKGYHEMHVAPHSRLPTPIYQERSPVSKFAHLPQRHLYLCPPGALDLDKSPNYKVLEHQFVNESSSLSPQNVRGSYPTRSERYVYRSPPPPYSAAVSLPYAVIPAGAPSLSSAGRYDLPSYPYKHHLGPGGLKRAFSETAGPPVQMEMSDRGASVAAHKLHVMVPSREFGSYRHGPSAFHPVHGSYGIDNSARIPNEASAYCQAGIYSDRSGVPGVGQSAAAFPECRRPSSEADGPGLMDSPRGRPQEDTEGAYAAGVFDGRMDEKQKAAEGPVEEDTACPSSPPMPVINNVFSLAPYKAYLEASGILPSQSDIKDGAPRLQSPKVEERSEPGGPKQEAERAELGPCKQEVETEDAGGYPLKQEERGACDAGLPRLFERDIKVEDTALDLRVKKPADGQVLSVVKAEAADESPRAAEHAKGVPFALKPSTLTLRDSRPDGAGQVCPLYEPSPLPCLKLSAIKLILPDIVKTAPPSVPDCSLPVGDGSVNEKSQRHSLRYFMELHHSLCKLIDGAFAVCSKEELGSILAKMDAVPTKPKSIPQILEVFRSSRGKEMSAKSGEISSALSCVLSQLETYIYIRKCPFPHVIRTGTIFIPMLVVKETLFPQLEGALVDQVLQEHRVELRPTTLSEERHLTQVQQRGCSSKLRRLLSLKHLPGIYPDLLKLYCDASLRTHLGTECDAPVQTEPSETPASPPPHHGHQATAKQLRPGLHFQRKRRKGRRRNPLNRTFVGASEKDAAIRVRDKRGRLKAATLRGSSSFRNSSQVTVQQIKSQKLLKGVWGRRKKKPGMGGKTKQKRAFEKSRAAGLVLKLKRMPLRGQAGGRERGFSPQESCGIKVQLTEVTSEQSGPAPKKPLPRLAHAALSSKKLRASAVAGSLRSTRSTSKVLHLRRSVVQIKFRRLLSLRPGTPRGRRRAGYPDLVGKRIRHLYEEKDKSEVWYQGMVVRVHEKHPNPLKTVYEVKYDSEPEWQYYLELLQDYRKGWLVLDD